MNIFEENQKIHRKNILEHEEREIKFWIKIIGEAEDIEKMLNILYNIHGNQSPRVFRILLRYTIRRVKSLTNETPHM